MAAGTLPKPGTKYGPCRGNCEHRDCAQTRRMADAVCGRCEAPIGYNTRFYQIDGSAAVLEHAYCTERRTGCE